MKKLSLSLIIGLAFTIFLLDSLRPKMFYDMRQAILVVSTPIADFLSIPIESVNGWVLYFNSVQDMHAKNKRLVLANAELKDYERQYKSMSQQNRELRKLLNYNKKIEEKSVVARVISDTGGIYARTLLLNSGSSSGVSDGLGVLTSKGLLGRTVHTAYNNTRVLLLTDINSEIPVVIEEIKEYAIMSGSVTDFPVLKFVRDKHLVKVGYHVLTSGHGGVFPPGVDVGTVVSVDDGYIKVRLNAKPNDTSFVRIVSFKYTKYLDKVTE